MYPRHVVTDVLRASLAPKCVEMGVRNENLSRARENYADRGILLNQLGVGCTPMILISKVNSTNCLTKFP